MHVPRVLRRFYGLHHHATSHRASARLQARSRPSPRFIRGPSARSAERGGCCARRAVGRAIRVVTHRVHPPRSSVCNRGCVAPRRGRQPARIPLASRGSHPRPAIAPVRVRGLAAVEEKSLTGARWPGERARARPDGVLAHEAGRCRAAWSMVQRHSDAAGLDLLGQRRRGAKQVQMPAVRPCSPSMGRTVINDCLSERERERPQTQHETRNDPQRPGNVTAKFWLLAVRAECHRSRC